MATLGKLTEMPQIFLEMNLDPKFPVLDLAWIRPKDF